MSRVSELDRNTRLILVHEVVERLRDYGEDAFDELFAAMDKIEGRHKQKPVRTSRVPIDDILPESAQSMFARLAELPEDEQDAIFDIISLLIDIDAPRR
jgi:hypothetical protein